MAAEREQVEPVTPLAVGGEREPSPAASRTPEDPADPALAAIAALTERAERAERAAPERTRVTRDLREPTNYPRPLR